jgi:transcriptional regulator with XRE-family HTH domain
MTRKIAGDIRTAFGAAVRAFREAKGFSQERLADLADIHRTYIGDVERGTRNISLLNMAKIAGALGVRLSELLKQAEKHR